MLGKCCFFPHRMVYITQTFDMSPPTTNPTDMFDHQQLLLAGNILAPRAPDILTLVHPRKKTKKRAIN